MDHSVVRSLNALLRHHDALEDPVSLYETASQALFAGLLVALVALAVARRTAWPARTAVAAGASAAGGLLVATLLAHLVDRARPFVADPGQVRLFADHAADPSFPSDHATAAFAIAVTLLLRERRLGVPVLLAAIVLAVGRVAIGVHWPTDVLAGAALGAAAALLLHVAVVRRRVDAATDLVLRRLRPA